MDNKFSNIKERILYLTDYYSISKELFFENIGMTYGSFKGSAKERPLNSDAIVKILSIYTEINSDWLIMGKGDMIKSKNELFFPDNLDLEIDSNSDNSDLSKDSRFELINKLLDSNEKISSENNLLKKIIIDKEKIITGLEFKVATLEEKVQEKSSNPPALVAGGLVK